MLANAIAMMTAYPVAASVSIIFSLDLCPQLLQAEVCSSYKMLATTRVTFTSLQLNSLLSLAIVHYIAT